MTLSIINDSIVNADKDPFVHNDFSSKFSRAYRDGSEDHISIGLKLDKESGNEDT